MAEFPRCRLSSWTDIDRWSDRIAESIDGAHHRPETIVGLTRGGWVASRLLADRLGVKRLVALRAQHWGVTATPDGKASLTESITTDLSGQNVLVVDDITDTGESLELAVGHVRDRRPARLESATLLHITHSKYRPTYVGEEIPRDAWVWVVFPWNYWEDLTTLGRRAFESTGTVEKARALLAEKTGWDAPSKDLERVLGPAA